MAGQIELITRQFLKSVCLLALSTCLLNGWLLVMQQSACAGEAENREPQAFNRLVSLAPSNTELIYSLGGDGKLIAVSTYCDYPPAARKKEKAGSFATANLERLARLKPDAIVLVDGQESLAYTLKRQGFTVKVLNNTRLLAIADNLLILGKLTGLESKAKSLSAGFNEELKQLADITARAKERPRVFYCVWPRPLLTVGKSSFLDDVITKCGGTNIAANIMSAYPQFSLERLVLANPDVIIMPYEARDQKFLKSAPWTSLKAVKQGRVYFLPEHTKNSLARPTLRVTAGLYWLAQKLHPDLSDALKSWYSKAGKSKPKSALANFSAQICKRLLYNPSISQNEEFFGNRTNTEFRSSGN